MRNITNEVQHRKDDAIEEESIMKKALAFLLTGVLALGTLAGCGGSDKKTEESAEAGEEKVIKVAASATPHAEILEQAAPLLEKDGWT